MKKGHTAMQVIGSVVALLVITAGAAGAGQEPLQKAKALYAAAAYEDALAVLTAIPKEARLPHIEQYRVFCLLALGHTVQADAAIEAVLLADPLYQPDPAEASPRMIQAFTSVRSRILPTVAKGLYLESKAALDRKDRQKAVEGFENLLRILASADTSDSTIGDMTVLAEGFLDLSRALPEPAETFERAGPVSASRPGSGRAAATPPGASGSGSAATTAATTRAVAIKQEIPRWIVPDAASRRLEFTGLIRVRVGADGRVQDTELIKRLHPAYDQLLMRAAREWLYEPAREAGVAVPSDVVVEVRLRPQE